MVDRSEIVILGAGFNSIYACYRKLKDGKNIRTKNLHSKFPYLKNITYSFHGKEFIFLNKSLKFDDNFLNQSIKYEKFMPSTIFTQNIDEIKNFFKKNKYVILKPIHSFGGNDIHLLNKFKLDFIKKFIKKHNYVMCQKYLSKISKGDKRVFLINGKVCGVISRVPKKGSYLSNMSKGAIAKNVKLTKLANSIISFIIDLPIP